MGYGIGIGISVLFGLLPWRDNRANSHTIVHPIISREKVYLIVHWIVAGFEEDSVGCCVRVEN